MGRAGAQMADQQMELKPPWQTNGVGAQVADQQMELKPQGTCCYEIIIADIAFFSKFAGKSPSSHAALWPVKRSECLTI